MCQIKVTVLLCCQSACSNATPPTWFTCNSACEILLFFCLFAVCILFWLFHLESATCQSKRNLHLAIKFLLVLFIFQHSKTLCISTIPTCTHIWRCCFDQWFTSPHSTNFLSCFFQNSKPSHTLSSAKQQKGLEAAVNLCSIQALPAAFAGIPQPAVPAPPAVTVIIVTIKLPEFWAIYPNTWFSQVEAPVRCGLPMMSPVLSAKYMDVPILWLIIARRDPCQYKDASYKLSLI
jgi:hypothetical protein